MSSGKGDGVGCVGEIVEEGLCEEIVEVERVSSGFMAVVAVHQNDVLRLICGYAPQSGRYLEGQSFYDELKGE